MRIIHSATKCVGEFGVEDQHVREVVAFCGERTEPRETAPVLIHPGNLKITRKETMRTKDATETFEYYEYPEN